jgi:hypothetical protein
MVKPFPEFRRQAGDTDERARGNAAHFATSRSGGVRMGGRNLGNPTPEKGARARSCEPLDPPCLCPHEVGSQGHGTESGATHTLAGDLSQTIPGTRSARPRRVTTEPEATGEPEGRLGVGSLFPVPLPDEVFGHRGAPCRAEPVAVEKRRAGITTLGRLRGTPAAGTFLILSHEPAI